MRGMDVSFRAQGPRLRTWRNLPPGGENELRLDRLFALTTTCVAGRSFGSERWFLRRSLGDELAP